MSEKTKMLAGDLYDPADEELVKGRRFAREICTAYNSIPDGNLRERGEALKKLLGTKPERIHVEPSFRCDYGYNIHVGEDFYANFDLVVLDVCEVRIGKNCMIGPRVSLCTAAHPLDAKTRNSGVEFGRPITIGDNAWLGAHVVINPGVTLGDNVVVAAGAVVTRSFEGNVVIGGVPAKILKRI
ncbi:sugar O-acetyltransferase [Kiritimatiellaeota bacterium B1221]|nr:sugar O-acetyltransferase [Kiritimatiellaeota bacterium B1221]